MESAMNTHPHRRQNTGSTFALKRCLKGMPLPHSQQKGFTIVEVLVAVVVFSVGLAAVAGMQTRSIQQSTFSDQMTMRVNAATHWAETLMRLPVMDETVSIDGGTQIDVEVSEIFDEEHACQYGDETCAWTNVEFAYKAPQTVRQRITRGYPLPNLVMVEMEVEPRGVSSSVAERRAVRTAFIRSLRWN